MSLQEKKWNFFSKSMQDFVINAFSIVKNFYLVYEVLNCNLVLASQGSKRALGSPQLGKKLEKYCLFKYSCYLCRDKSAFGWLYCVCRQG